MKKVRVGLWMAALLGSAAFGSSASSQPARKAPPPELRLYTLDCGRIDFDDLKGFSDTGEHDGEK